MATDNSMISWTPISQGEGGPFWVWPHGSGFVTVRNDPWRVVFSEGKEFVLPSVVWIDRAFFVGNKVLLADWRSKNLWQVDPDHNVSLFPLPEPVDIAAIHEISSGELWVLVRSLGQLQSIDYTGAVRRRLGTRIGVASENRLGFEWPDDAVFSDDGRNVLIADAGNDRLVRLNLETERFMSFPLPISPRFILYDGPEGWLISDGADSLLWGSDRYGPIGHESGQIMPCCRIFRHAGTLYGADEAGLWGEILVKKPCTAQDSKIPLARLLLAFEKNERDVNTLLSGVDLHTVKEILRYQPNSRHLSDYLIQSDFLLRQKPDPWSGLEQLELDAKALHDLARGAVGEKNSETSMVERTVLAYGIRKQFWQLIQAVQKWCLLLEQLSRQANLSDCLLQMNQGIAEEARFRIQRVAHELNEQNSDIQQESLRTMLVRYSLARAVLEELGQNPGSDRISLFHRGLVMAIQSIDVLAADIFLKKRDFERFKAGYEQAILDHPDRPSLSMAYINKLFEIGDLDTIEKRLSAMTNQQQENLNIKLSNLFRARGQLDKAVKSLRQELDLYPNRLDLIPALLSMTSVDEGELNTRIKRGLIASEQQIDTHYHLGRIYLYRGRPIDALNSFLEEIERFPEQVRSLLEIKDLLFCWPAIRQDLRIETYRRIWQALVRHIWICANLKDLGHGMWALLLVLNYIEVEETELKDLYNRVRVMGDSRWTTEIEAVMAFREWKRNDTFQTAPDRMVSWLESLACRERVANEMLKANDPGAVSSIRRLFPEALVSSTNQSPLFLALDKGRCRLQNQLNFNKAAVLKSHLVWSRPGACELQIRSLENNSSRDLQIPIHPSSPVSWTAHPQFGTLLVFKNVNPLIVDEIDVAGTVLFSHQMTELPDRVLPVEKGFLLFWDKALPSMIQLWHTGLGPVGLQSTLEWQPVNWRPVGVSLCYAPDKHIYRYCAGQFLHLFDHSSSSMMIRACTTRQDHALLILEMFRGVPCGYLGVYSLSGQLRQRIPFPWGGIDWIDGSQMDMLYFGRRGGWIAGLEIVDEEWGDSDA